MEFYGKTVANLFKTYCPISTVFNDMVQIFDNFSLASNEVEIDNLKFNFFILTIMDKSY